MAYEARFTVADKLTETTKVVTLSSGSYPIFFPTGGRAVSFGMIGDEQDAIQIAAGWKLYHGAGDTKRELTDAFLRSEIRTGVAEPTDTYVLPTGYFYLQLEGS